MFDQEHTLNHWIRPIFDHPVFSPPKVGQMNFALIWQAPIVFFQKWFFLCFSFYEYATSKGVEVDENHRRWNRGGGGQGGQWPLHFSEGGMAPPLFWQSCSKVKKTPQ